MLFRILETSDLDRLSSFWAETVGHKTIQVETELNKEKELNISLGKWLDQSKPGSMSPHSNPKKWIWVIEMTSQRSGLCYLILLLKFKWRRKN